MRMDRSAELTAKVIVNEWPEEEITRILFEYGEEKNSPEGSHRRYPGPKQGPIETTGQLVELIKAGIPAAARRTGPHPAKRSFQAFRIAVNDELRAFEDALEQSVRCLAPGGRLAVITFHSLEDRICKKTFAGYVANVHALPISRCACAAMKEF